MSKLMKFVLFALTLVGVGAVVFSLSVAILGISSSSGTSPIGLHIPQLTSTGTSSTPSTLKLSQNSANKVQSGFKLVNATPKFATKLKLSSSNMIFLQGMIDDGSVYQVISSLNQLNESGSGPIYLVINSGGGNVLSGFQLITAMQASKRPVYTVCLEICASMAAYTHQFGRKRFMTNRSILMFHDAFGQFNGNIRQQLSMLETLNSMLNKLDLHIALKSHQDYNYFQARVQSRNLWMDAQTSVTRGFADGIVYVILPSGTFTSPAPSDSIGRKNHQKVIQVEENNDKNLVKQLQNVRM